MVDPNRKINRLTDKDIEFLEECEREFGLRYTEEDADFMEHCTKPLDDPPIVENWNFGGGGDNANKNDGGNRNYNRGGNRHNRNWRGYPGGERHRQKDHSFRPRRGFGGGGGGGGSSSSKSSAASVTPPPGLHTKIESSFSDKKCRTISAIYSQAATTYCGRILNYNDETKDYNKSNHTRSLTPTTFR
ncbi:hypothetical protein DOY81_010278 [Sarcophaga bullata]|nr:hypothetical protein DOY81_010278 [Sarcophaga bullata]